MKHFCKKFIWTAGQDCGNEDILNTLSAKRNNWDMEDFVTIIENGICKPASANNEGISEYYFDIHISFNKGKYIDDSKTEIWQEIWDTVYFCFSFSFKRRIIM